MEEFYKRFLRSNFVWFLSGLSYYTAVIATHGRYVTKDQYLNDGINEMSIFHKYLDKSKTVIEFGCGLGKNLFAIANKIKFGYGIDINSLYIRLANRLMKKYGLYNLIFLKYDGINFPDIPRCDIILEKGVFERLPKELVKTYIHKLKNKYLKRDGIMILYFLMKRAKGTEFTKRLGDNAYVYWSYSEIRELVCELGLKVNSTIETKLASYYICTESL
jgi:cyclopropane fatty-acyl-phospholipid synthase-like methyltransferase